MLKRLFKEWSKVDVNRLVKLDNGARTELPLLQQDVRVGPYIGICVFRTKIHTWLFLKKDCRLQSYSGAR